MIGRGDQEIAACLPSWGACILSDILPAVALGVLTVIGLLALALTLRGRERRAALGGTILASPLILGLAILVPLICLYLALDWIGAAASGIGRLVLAVIG